jgi:hypothetical protein
MEASTQSSLGWYTGYFRFSWPTKSEPQWYLDLIIGHAVVAPVIHRYLQGLSLWYFHRRANRDERGHEFAFSFLTTAEHAQEISVELQGDSLLKDLHEAGLVLEDTCANLESIPTSEKPPYSWHDWPSSVQNSWPHFVMGACQTWLKLADILLPAIQQTSPASDLNIILQHYQQLLTQINDLWQKNGAHAFLHHLNAVFGYIPVRLGNELIVF